MINRKQLVQKHNPKLTAFNVHSPLSVGNGEFVFTADVTGLQSFAAMYDTAMPLCTMANWGWHITPFSDEIKAFVKHDIEPTYYDTYGRAVPYWTSRADADKYNWVRQNPHKANLANIGFVLRDKQQALLTPDDVQGIAQELDLYTGILHSRFDAAGSVCDVITAVAAESDVLAVQAKSEMIAQKRMDIRIAFAYPTHEITGSDWTQENKHTSAITKTNHGYLIERKVDDFSYTVHIAGDDFSVTQMAAHEFIVVSENDGFDLTFAFNNVQDAPMVADDVLRSSTLFWHDYWMHGGMISLEKSTDPRALELERRIILSMYQTALQCGGTLPPAETGLVCNSWYGKFHLEMHFWHAAHFVLFNRPQFLEKSLQWYKDIMPTARAATAEQGYNGIRWPKMTDKTGIDSPSPIGPLLIWQQPHVILYCDWILKAQTLKDKNTLRINDCATSDAHHEHSDAAQAILNTYRDLVFETAEFMASYAHFDGTRYVLGPPNIPAQERHDARTCINPVYELEYWVYGLKTAIWWLKQLGENPPVLWQDIVDKLAMPKIVDGVYVAQDNAPDTFTNVAKDHPSMLMAYGVIGSRRIDPTVMNATLDKVFDVWDYPSMWGWDFGVMAMTAVRLNRPETAIEVLLKVTEKNVYEINGHNRQVLRNDLPLYLPGNGALLLAVAMMAAGYENCEMDTPGFNVDGFDCKFENIMPYSAEC